MVFDLLILAAGLVLLVKGGDLFVGASVRIAELLRMPRLVIGSTLVSLATTTPELGVSIVSGFTEESHMAFGNAVGSCICNIALILGLTAAYRQIDAEWRHLRNPLLIMTACGLLLLLALYLDGRLSRWEGWALVLAGAAYFGLDFRRHLRAPGSTPTSEAHAIRQEVADGVSGGQSKASAIGRFLLGTGFVIGGSRLLVDGAVALAMSLGVSEIVIGLTIVAVGTSLPELITAISSVRQRVSDLSVGNILGANIANLTFVIGTAAGIFEIEIGSEDLVLNFGTLFVLFALFIWIIRSGRCITRQEGWWMLVFYLAYVLMLFTRGLR